jgi:hypothetical protein
MLDLNNNKFMTKEEIRQVASSVFTKEKGGKTSDHYKHISTEQIIDDMSALGWGVVDAKQVRARKGMGFQKHLVVFGNPEIVINGSDGDTVFPRILLTNSHDGKNAFSFTAGLFRMVCENGLVISDQNFSSLKIRHMGYDFEELQKTINTMVEKLPLTVECMNRLKQTELDEVKKQEFALAALGLRFDTQNLSFNVDEILEPTREQDKGNDLWSVYNVVQEKLIHGMVNYQNGNKNRKARKIKNFQQDIKLNSELYELAMEYAA